MAFDLWLTPGQEKPRARVFLGFGKAEVSVDAGSARTHLVIELPGSDTPVLVDDAGRIHVRDTGEEQAVDP